MGTAAGVAATVRRPVWCGQRRSGGSPADGRGKRTPPGCAHCADRDRSTKSRCDRVGRLSHPTGAVPFVVLRRAQLARLGARSTNLGQTAHYSQAIAHFRRSSIAHRSPGSGGVAQPRQDDRPTGVLGYAASRAAQPQPRSPSRSMPNFNFNFNFTNFNFNFTGCTITEQLHAQTSTSTSPGARRVRPGAGVSEPFPLDLRHRNPRGFPTRWPGLQGVSRSRRGWVVGPTRRGCSGRNALRCSVVGVSAVLACERGADFCHSLRRTAAELRELEKSVRHADVIGHSDVHSGGTQCPGVAQAVVSDRIVLGDLNQGWRQPTKVGRQQWGGIRMFGVLPARDSGRD